MNDKSSKNEAVYKRKNSGLRSFLRVKAGLNSASNPDSAVGSPKNSAKMIQMNKVAGQTFTNGLPIMMGQQ